MLILALQAPGIGEPVMAQRGQTAAPYFSLARAAWIPYALAWDPETGELHRAEGPLGFGSYREAVEASRFLMRDRYTFQVLR